MSIDSLLHDSPIAELIDAWFPAGDSALQPLRERLQLVQLPAGYDVFRLGDTCRNYLIVIAGSVRVQALSTAGREVVLYRVTDTQSCVITTACLISGEAYPAQGVTESATTGMLLPQPDFNVAMEQSAAFRRFVFANHGRRLGDLIQRIEDVAFGRVDARLARHLVDRSQGRGGTIVATHQQLASELGTAREVVSRQLKGFEKQGWIRVLRGSVEVLQPQSLARLWKNAN